MFLILHFLHLAESQSFLHFSLPSDQESQAGKSSDYSKLGARPKNKSPVISDAMEGLEGLYNCTSFRHSSEAS